MMSYPASLGITGYLLDKFLRVEVTHQRKSEPFLSEVFQGSANVIDAVIYYQEPVMRLSK